MIRVGSIINAYGQSINVFIYTGQYVRDRWVNNMPPAKVTLFGSLQPVSGKELELLPEGTRLTDIKRVFSQTAIDIDDFQFSPGVNNVQFIIQGKTYRLLKKPEWDKDYFIYTVQLLRSDDEVPS